MMKRLKVTVDDKVYEVSVEMLDEGTETGSLPVAAPHSPVASPVAQVIAPAPLPAATPAAATSPGDIRSPLAGKVVAIGVKPGDQVTEGQQVMTLEAMKMNTYIYATKAGRVTAVLAKPGDAVDEGAPLITIA